MRKREYIHLPRHLGDCVADVVVTGLGSWAFVIGQAVVLFLWFVLNSVGWFFHWDSYPFILCNLFMSAEAAFASPLILMSQNRQADKDEQRDNIEAEEVAELYAINHTQLELLQKITAILEILQERQEHKG